MSVSKNRLNRYTNLPTLLDILSSRTLTLLKPEYWDDKNDSYYLKVYKNRMKLNTLLALCFTKRSETYHHWKVFSDGSGGVCIQLNKERLINVISTQRNFEWGDVIYKRIRDNKSVQPTEDELPYIKRVPYEDDSEFRIIYKNKNTKMDFKRMNFDLDCIEKITLSPWMHESILEAVKMVIHSIGGCSKISVSKSTLIDNKTWRKIADVLK